METGDVRYVICGGKIGQGGTNQACITTVVPNSNTCGVRAHSVKAKGFEDGKLYVTTPSVRGRKTVYLSHSLASLPRANRYFIKKNIVGKLLSCKL